MDEGLITMAHSLLLCRCSLVDGVSRYEQWTDERVVETAPLKREVFIQFGDEFCLEADWSLKNTEWTETNESGVRCLSCKWEVSMANNVNT